MPIPILRPTRRSSVKPRAWRNLALLGLLIGPIVALRAGEFMNLDFDEANRPCVGAGAYASKRHTPAAGLRTPGCEGGHPCCDPPAGSPRPPSCGTRRPVRPRPGFCRFPPPGSASSGWTPPWCSPRSRRPRVVRAGPREFVSVLFRTPPPERPNELPAPVIDEGLCASLAQPKQFQAVRHEDAHLVLARAGSPPGVENWRPGTVHTGGAFQDKLPLREGPGGDRGGLNRQLRRFLLPHLRVVKDDLGGTLRRARLVGPLQRQPNVCRRRDDRPRRSRQVGTADHPSDGAIGQNRVSLGRVDHRALEQDRVGIILVQDAGGDPHIGAQASFWLAPTKSARSSSVC